MKVTPIKRTYTLEASQVELDILQSIVGNTAGHSFHRIISSMYNSLREFATPHEPYILVVEGVTYRINRTVTFLKEN